MAVYTYIQVPSSRVLGWVVGPMGGASLSGSLLAAVKKQYEKGAPQQSAKMAT